MSVIHDIGNRKNAHGERDRMARTQITFGNQVCAVQGSKRAALLDLHRGRLQRVPRSLIAAFVNGILVDNNLITDNWRDYLIANSFLVENSSLPFWANYRISWDVPPYPKIHTLVIGKASEAEIVHQWMARSKRYTPRHLIFESANPVNDKSSLIYLSQSMGVRSFEIVDGDLKLPYRSMVFNSAGKHLFDRIVQHQSRSLANMMRIEPSFYNLSTKYSESLGYLYIDGTRILPHQDEKWMAYGDISNCGLDSVLLGERYREFNATSKDQRQVCKDCELRYACTHSISNRLTTLPSSAPDGCPYDPNSDDDQNYLFEDNA